MDQSHFTKIVWFFVGIVAMIIILNILCSSSRDMIEGFNPWLDYSRAYPGTFSYRYGYGPFFRPFYNSWPGNPQFGTYGNVRYNPGYSDYWYIPAHEYLNRWMNGPDGLVVPDGCIVPPHTSEYCVNERVQETGNLDAAIAQCTVPSSVSESCASLRDWSGPLTYRLNDINNVQVWN